MFLKMFKSGRIAVKKAAPAAVTLTELPRQHPFNGLFAVKAQKTYAGRQAFIPAIDKTLDKPAAASPKPVKPKTIEGMPEIHQTLTQMLGQVKDVAGTVEALNVRIAAIEQAKASVDRTLKSLAPVIGHIKGGPSVPEQQTTLKFEIANLARLISTATNHREIAVLRQQLAVKCEHLDNLERAAAREAVKKSAQAGELSLLRGYLTGSGIACRTGL
jgi:hypothetical protein